MSEETAFLDAIRCKPDDDVTRLVYADWLDEQGDDRNKMKSAYIRLDCRLATLMADSDEYVDLLSRRRELAKKLTRKWLAIVSKVVIENCSVQFEFECPKKWDELRPTKKNSVRYCDACRQNVYYCNEIVTARFHAQSGKCVALDPSISRAEGDLEVRMLRMGKILLPQAYPPLEE